MEGRTPFASAPFAAEGGNTIPVGAGLTAIASATANLLQTVRLGAELRAKATSGRETAPGEINGCEYNTLEINSTHVHEAIVALTVGRRLAADLCAASTLTPPLAVAKYLTASVVGAVAMTGTAPSLDKRMVANAASPAATTANLAVGKPLAGSGAGQGAGTAAMGVGKPLGGSSGAQATGTGALAKTAPLAVNAFGRAVLWADTTIGKPLASALIAGNASVGASLGVNKTLGASMACSASASATTPAIGKRLGAAPQAEASGSGSIGQRVMMASGAALAANAMTASLAVAKPLAGAASVAASITAPMGLVKPLGGSGQSQSDLDGDVSVAKLMRANAMARSSIALPSLRKEAPLGADVRVQPDAAAAMFLQKLLIAALDVELELLAEAAYYQWTDSEYVSLAAGGAMRTTADPALPDTELLAPGDSEADGSGWRTVADPTQDTADALPEEELIVE
jgi:hypothetical protein